MSDLSPHHAYAPRGAGHYRAKLTESDVRHLHQLAAERRALQTRISALSNRELAAKFDVTESCVERVLYGQTWTHVSPHHLAPHSTTEKETFA